MVLSLSRDNWVARREAKSLLKEVAKTRYAKDSDCTRSFYLIPNLERLAYPVKLSEIVLGFPPKFSKKSFSNSQEFENDVKFLAGTLIRSQNA